MTTFLVRTSTSMIHERAQVRVHARLAAAVLLFVAGGTEPLTAADPPPSARLAEREQELLRQYAELELSFLRLADLLDASDPRRAAALRSACETARGEQVADRLATVVELLKQGQLLKAGTTQEQAIEQLQALLDRLAAGAEPQRPGDTTREVRAFLGRLSKAIARQREIADATETGRSDDELAGRQDELAKEARGLADDLGRFAERMAGIPAGGDKQQAAQPAADPADPTDGSESDSPQQKGRSDTPGADAESAQPSADGEPQTSDGPADPEPEGDDEAARAKRSRQRLIAAQERMDAARERLEQAQRGESRREQDKALEELENARAELEEILRQVREEEVERLLVQLEARVREMLRAQRGVQSAADALAGGASAGRERELAAAKLGREQEAVGAAAVKALALVRDDGTAVAIPQALEQIRDDAQQAAARLARGDVGGTTRGIVGDLVAGLEELLAALEKAHRDRKEQEQQAKSFGGSPPQPGDQPLVDALAELKMIRSLQLRVNGRTQRFATLLGDGVEQAEEPELRQALERLADRQRLIEQAAHDIVAGRTE
jgi:hypothetical protein